VGSNPTSAIEPNPQKTGVWHKRLHIVIVEVRLFPCIPLSRS
jgi:hypothetical protein